MYQSFETPGSGGATGQRLTKLRALMKSARLDAFLIPRSDEHQGEYVAPGAERLAFMTGFTGSAGLAAVAQKSAALFVDGRYVVQAPGQVDLEHIDVLQIPDNKLHGWLIGELPKGAKVGFDPWLHRISQIIGLDRELKAKDIALKPVARNPVDRTWGKDRPDPPRGPVIIQPLDLAGESAADKIARLQKGLKDKGQTHAILTLPDSICWLLNIRGSDIAHNPVVLAFAILPASGRVELFIDADKLDRNARTHLKPLARLHSPDDLPERMAILKNKQANVRLDPATAAWWFYARLGGRLGQKPKRISTHADPCLLPKAIKNETEIAGAREAHKRDGQAVCRFLAWLDDKADGADRGNLDEISAARQLEAFRHDTGVLKELSFDTISGAGPNGAIVHYRVTEATNRRLKSGELYLVDSGAQYADGTTDITRTIAIGKPTREMRRRFTLVLKGHIAIATARFPKGTRGIDLDPFARRALWDDGLDFDHGTGHGIGSYLSVHEGPQSISRAGMAALQPGMIISNEPGYYKEGAYGIRIENLVLTKPLGKFAGGDREMMSFETLTLAPIDRRLVDADLLMAGELAWLNAYHAKVAKLLKSGLDKATRQWLAAATNPIG